MSMGRVIQDMQRSLEAMKQINATAPVPMFEQGAMEWAIGQLQDRFPGKYVSVKCEKSLFHSGRMETECRVYVDGIGGFTDKSFTLAMKKLVDAYAKPDPEPDPEDVPANATPQAVAEAKPPIPF